MYNFWILFKLIKIVIVSASSKLCFASFPYKITYVLHLKKILSQLSTGTIFEYRHLLFTKSTGLVKFYRYAPLLLILITAQWAGIIKKLKALLIDFYPIKLHKPAIASCVLISLLVAQLCGIGSTRPSAHAHTTCRIGLMMYSLWFLSFRVCDIFVNRNRKWNENNFVSLELKLKEKLFSKQNKNINHN